MATGSISLKYSTKGLVLKRHFDCRTIIRTDVEKLRFSTSFEKGGVGVSYISAPELSPSENVLIIDNSFRIENNNLEEATTFIKMDDRFAVDHANFYLSDVFIEQNGETVPLFFWHQLPVDYDFSHLELLDSNYSPITSDQWVYYDETQKLGYARRGIYTNLQTKYDLENNEYEVYYVRFKRLDTQEIVTELLDSNVFYSESAFLAPRNQRKYIKRQELDHYEIEVIFDSINYSPTSYLVSQRYGVQIDTSSVISIKKPAAFSAAERWYLRITPGDIKIAEKRYWVPEYFKQLFNPVFPYKRAQNKLAKKLTETLLYTDLFPIANLGVEGFFVEIIVKNDYGGVVQAITNDPNADTYIAESGALTDIVYEKDIIESIATNSGIIKLKKPLEEGKVILNYRYIENYYTYSKLIVNPSIHPDILSKRIVMFVSPDENDSAINHLIVSDTGLILDASQDNTYISVSSIAEEGTTTYLVDSTLPSDGDYYSGFELEILSGDNSGIRVKIASYSGSFNRITFGDSLPHAITPGTLYKINKYYQSYNYYDSTLQKLYHYTGWEDYSMTRQEHRIADVYIVQKIVETDIQSYDVRVFGGGLKEDKIFEATTLQEQATWYWDIGNWDGSAYPGMGATLIELPREILKELGGPFSREQIESIVSRHLGAGSYPLIQYYDKSTEIINLEAGDGYVDIEWRKITANKFNIYIGNSSDNLIFLRSEPGTRTKTRIENLENNKTYYLQIESVVGGIPRLRSRTIAFVPYSFVELAPPILYSDGVMIKNKYLGGTYD